MYNYKPLLNKPIHVLFVANNCCGLTAAGVINYQLTLPLCPCVTESAMFLLYLGSHLRFPASLPHLKCLPCFKLR